MTALIGTAVAFGDGVIADIVGGAVSIPIPVVKRAYVPLPPLKPCPIRSVIPVSDTPYWVSGCRSRAGLKVATVPSADTSIVPSRAMLDALVGYKMKFVFVTVVGSIRSL